MANPFDVAWALLKGLEHQQMFSASSPPRNLQEYSKRPWDYGLKREGTVHPAIYGMLQRKLIAEQGRNSGLDPILHSSGGVIEPPEPGEAPCPEYDKELQRYYIPNLRISKPEGYGGLEGGPIQNYPLSSEYGDYQQGYESGESMARGGHGSLFSLPSSGPGWVGAYGKKW